MVKHSINVILLLQCIILLNNVNAQCWESEEIPEGFKINNVYTLDSLIVSESIYKVLDHSIALVDSLSVNKSETWLYFVISIYSKYDSIYGNAVRLELNQGTNNDVFEYHSYFFQLEHCGAFCYRGYTFFVLSQQKDIFVFKELFTADKQKDFPVFYNKPTLQEKWIGIDFPETQKHIYVFYDYKNGELKYIVTRLKN